MPTFGGGANDFIDPKHEKHQRICNIVGTVALSLIALFLWGFILFAAITWDKDFTNEYS